MDRRLRVLLVEDSEDDAALLIRELRRGGYNPDFQRVETEEAMSAALDRESWDLIIADYAMPRFNALAALFLLKKRGLDLPFIIVSGVIGEETAVAAMKAGAHDYVMKGNTARLTAAIERELREADERRQRQRAEERIKYVAHHDSLTDLPNRVLLYERVQQTIAAAKETSGTLALLVMDLDHFKEINDTLGHAFGDLLLQQVATALRVNLRGCDTVARLGGDEFGVLLPGADAARARITAQTLLAALDQSFALGDTTVGTGASIGISIYPEHGADAETLLRRADIALYVAKRLNSHSVVYDPHEDKYSARRLALAGELRGAVQRGELVLHYQPQVRFASRHVGDAEALVRWQHPEHGLVPPAEFIPLAEQTGLIEPLTRWALQTATCQIRQWAQMEQMITVAVNLSAPSLQNPGLPSFIAELLAEQALPAQLLKLEITESALMANPTRAVAILEQLSALGIRVAIDDFGTGFSSLAYLKQLPVHEIKIDKSFVTNMVANSRDLAIVQSVVGLAHNLGLEVVAEGVEDEKTWRLLAALGCDAAQGYFIARPAPADELSSQVRARSIGPRLIPPSNGRFERRTLQGPGGNRELTRR